MANHRLCLICGKPIILSPSATERARKDVTGNTNAQFYLDLFKTHSECEINKREEETHQLMLRLKVA